MTSMKPILLDSLHICMGGGKILLDYLATNLLNQNVDFVLLKDERCPTLSCEKHIKKIVILPPNIKSRNAYYTKHKNDFSFVLCFGNIPAPLKISCKVYTYVHNVNLLKIPSDIPAKQRLMNWMKQKYIAGLAKNTDGWIVQTNNTKKCLIRALPHKGKEILLLPFYNVPQCSAKLNVYNKDRTDYILAGDYTGTRGHDELVEAWKILHRHGYNRRLHLTLSNDSDFARVVEKAVNDGIDIVNHGIIPFDDMTSLYGICKATVYPSHNESLGLGIIEAINAGCDVIGADLPYLHSICVPSITFQAGNPEAIANAVLMYEQNNSKKSKLTINNEIDSLIRLMKNGNS